MPRILAVDDSGTMRQMVSTTLKEAGHQVVEAADGQAGLEAAQKQPFDLVITDINMPRMDGLELIKQLRALPGFRFKPILCLTTETRQDKKQQARANGATGWLVKPFKPEQLLQTVQKVLPR